VNLREEISRFVTQRDLSPELYNQIQRLVSLVSRRKPPPPPHRTWTRDVCEDVTIDFIADKLDAGGGFRYVLDWNDDHVGLLYPLRLLLEQYLADRARRSAKARLAGRVREVLEGSGQFVLVSSGQGVHAAALWAAVGFEDGQVASASPALLARAPSRAAFAGEHVATDHYRSLIASILEVAGGPMTLADIVTVVAGHLQLATEVSIDDMERSPGNEDPGLLRTEEEDVDDCRRQADDVYSTITPRQRDALRLWAIDRLGIVEIGKRLGIGKSTVANEIARVKAVAEEVVERSGSDRLGVGRLLLERLSTHSVVERSKK
jgi:DNA-directed RNA polymerase specialized sigma24 family protein